MRKIVSLHGLIEVERRETPPSVVFVVLNDPLSCKLYQSPDGGPVTTECLTIDQYVRLSVLSKELQDRVREEIAGQRLLERILAGLHDDTRREMYEDAENRTKSGGVTP